MSHLLPQTNTSANGKKKILFLFYLNYLKLLTLKILFIQYQTTVKSQNKVTSVFQLSCCSKNIKVTGRRVF